MQEALLRDLRGLDTSFGDLGVQNATALTTIHVANTGNWAFNDLQNPRNNINCTWKKTGLPDVLAREVARLAQKRRIPVSCF